MVIIRESDARDSRRWSGAVGGRGGRTGTAQKEGLTNLCQGCGIQPLSQPTHQMKE